MIKKIKKLHKYSDNCLCDKCSAVWRDWLFKTVDENEKKLEEKKEVKL